MSFTLTCNKCGNTKILKEIFNDNTNIEIDIDYDEPILIKCNKCGQEIKVWE